MKTYSRTRKPIGNYLEINLVSTCLLFIFVIKCLPIKMISRRDPFQAIADPTRRAIIGLLAEKPLNLHSIAAHFDVSRPAISQHIKLLIECELVSVKQKGRESLCEVHIDKLQGIDDWLTPLKKAWENRFSKLDNILDNMDNFNQENNGNTKGI
jgi:DNA-binding transcriptional ArsR family regulator